MCFLLFWYNTPHVFCFVFRCSSQRRTDKERESKGMLTYPSDPLPQIVCPMDEDAIPPNRFCSAPPHSEPPPPLLPLPSITPRYTCPGTFLVSFALVVFSPFLFWALSFFMDWIIQDLHSTFSGNVANIWNRPVASVVILRKCVFSIGIYLAYCCTWCRFTCLQNTLASVPVLIHYKRLFYYNYTSYVTKVNSFCNLLQTKMALRCHPVYILSAAAIHTVFLYSSLLSLIASRQFQEVHSSSKTSIDISILSVLTIQFWGPFFNIYQVALDN